MSSPSEAREDKNGSKDKDEDKDKGKGKGKGKKENRGTSLHANRMKIYEIRIEEAGDVVVRIPRRHYQ